MSSPTATLYNAFPYEGHVFRTTHPNHLAMVARLYGLDTPPVESSRILELGCANGENLIPIAYGLPNAQAVGIDLSSRQVDTARKIAADLALNNITFQAADILALDDSIGQFDYIICHGVYSWVPEAVQKKILDLCRRNLSPKGVAYISYNCYPGWHTRMIVRDMMLYHTRQFDDPVKKVAQARAYIEFLASAVFERQGPLAALLKEMLEALNEKGDFYILHEYLEPHNVPLHFYQFAQQLADNQLDYLADTDFSTGFPAPLTKDAAETLQKITPDYVAWEQHLDFLRSQAFRKSLVVHARTQPIIRNVKPAALHHLFLSTILYPIVDATPESPERIARDDPRLFSDQIVQFTTLESGPAKKKRRGTIGAADPLLKNALVELFQQWPMPISLADLTARVRQCVRTRVSPEILAQLDDPERLAKPLLQCAKGELIELHAVQPRITISISERPQTSAIARRELSLLDPAHLPAEILLTTLRHQQTQSAIPPDIIRLADGTRTVPEIVDAILAADPQLPDGTPATRPYIESSVSRSLNWLARNALLVS